MLIRCERSLLRGKESVTFAKKIIGERGDDWQFQAALEGVKLMEFNPKAVCSIPRSYTVILHLTFKNLMNSHFQNIS